MHIQHFQARIRIRIPNSPFQKPICGRILSPDIGRWLLRRAKIVRDLGPVNPFWIGSGPPKVGGWGPPALQIKASFRYRPAAVGAQPLKLYRKHRKYPFIPKMPGGIYDVMQKFVSILVNKQGWYNPSKTWCGSSKGSLFFFPLPPIRSYQNP